jgi:hypothetical protein
MTTVAIATERRKLRRELGRLDTVFLLLSAIAVAGTGQRRNRSDRAARVLHRQRRPYGLRDMYPEVEQCRLPYRARTATSRPRSPNAFPSLAPTALSITSWCAALRVTASVWQRTDCHTTSSKS